MVSNDLFNKLFTLLVTIFSFANLTFCQENIIIPREKVNEINLNTVLKTNQLRLYGEFHKEGPFLLNGGRSNLSKPRIKVLSNNKVGISVKSSKYTAFGKYKIDYISVFTPFNAKTLKGILLGESKKEDIVGKYGDPESVYPDRKRENSEVLMYSTKGIKFYIDTVVYKIDIFNPIIEKDE